MKGRVFISVLALTLALPINIISAATTYSVFYLNGDPAPPNEDGDATNFANGMANLGYNLVTHNSTLGNYTRPSVSNILNAKNSTFMYISGHGMPDTELFIGSLNSPTDSFAASFNFNKSWNYPNTSKDDPYNYVGSSEIGIDYIDTSGTMTNSRWDGDMKWLFLGACSQLDFKASDTSDSFPSKPDAVYNGLYSASVWARTMLGYRSVYDYSTGSWRNTPKRLHGIAGYYGSAPAGDGDNNAINAFFEYTNAYMYRNIRTAWQDANSWPASNWAVLVHRSNSTDFVPGKQTGLTADTTGTPIIDLYRRDSSNYNVPLIQTNSSSSKIESFSSLGVTFRLAAKPTVQENTYSELSSELITPDINLLSRKLMGEISQKIQKDTNQTMISGNKSLTELKDGSVEYRNLNISNNKKQDDFFNEEQAVLKSKQFLKELGIYPEDAYLDGVSKTVRINDILNESQKPTTDILEYEVVLKHKFDGKTLNKDAITVRINSDGVSAMNFKWHKITGTSKDRRSVITPNEALNKFKEEIHKQWKVTPESDITEFNVEYSFDELEGVFKPVWKIVVNNDAPVLIDARK